MAALPAARVAAAALRAGRHRHRRDAAGADLRRLADLLHPSHLAGDQRQPYRRPDRERDRGRDRRHDAATRSAMSTNRPSVPFDGAGREVAVDEHGLRLHPLRRHRAPARRSPRRSSCGCACCDGSDISCRRACRCSACRRRTGSTRSVRRELLAAFDIGPTRTLQQDVEFGVIQIVDIASRRSRPRSTTPAPRSPASTSSGAS